MASNDALGQESEERAMLLKGIPATEFFTLYLSKSPGKRIHLLTSQRYLTIEQVSFIKNARGDEFPEGIDRFVEAALQDKSCYGLVPLTESAKQRLQDMKLESRPTGPLPMLDPKLKYTLYTKPL